MSKVAIEGNVSGTGTLTIAAPNTNTNRTITLPDATGTLALAGGASDKIEEGNSKVEVTDAGTGKVEVTVDNVEVADFTTGAIVFNETGANQDFRVEGDTDANLLFVDASADAVGMGAAVEANSKLTVKGAGIAISRDSSSVSTSSAYDIKIRSASPKVGIHATGGSQDMTLEFSGGNSANAIIDVTSNDGLVFRTNNAERVRITNDGYSCFGKTDTSNTANGLWISSLSTGDNFQMFVCTTRSDGGASPVFINRESSDGTLIDFRQANTPEGSISVSGSTISYNGGHLSRWAQMLTNPELFKGTVMSNLDEMNVYIAPTTYWTEEDELPEGVNVGDVKAETHEVENEQLNKVKVSDVEGDANVAGVFVNWCYDEAHQVDEINMAMTGDMIIRIGEGVTVARGDLLMSAGNGTAMPQGDDMVRSKTIAKVTSTHITCTYDDGSYCVPCVLMAC